MDFIEGVFLRYKGLISFKYERENVLLVAIVALFGLNIASGYFAMLVKDLLRRKC